MHDAAIVRGLFRILAAVSCLLSVACGSNSPGSSSIPSPSLVPNVTGTWSGQLQESGGAAAALKLTLQQQDHAVTGDFVLTLADATSGTGQISGSITGAKLEFNFVSGTSTCPATAEVGTATMSGGFTCSGVSAQFTLSRQAQ